MKTKYNQFFLLPFVQIHLLRKKLFAVSVKWGNACAVDRQPFVPCFGVSVVMEVNPNLEIQIENHVQVQSQKNPSTSSSKCLFCRRSSPATVAISHLFTKITVRQEKKKRQKLGVDLLQVSKTSNFASRAKTILPSSSLFSSFASSVLLESSRCC